MTDAATEPAYTVGDYLLDRLAELGVSEIFGVPGDYNLEFLDHIVAHPRLRWVGNANELNAGYAADGYGRLRGMSALVTTFGVGELSAANAVAGSYAEQVPVVHIVGGPSKDAQGTRRALHHSLGDGDFEHFFRVSREITCAQANLMPATARREIDRVLSEVREQKRPGYILLSTDVARFPTEPPEAALPRYTGGTSPRALAMFTEAAAALIGEHRITVLADLLVHRLQAIKELEALLAADVVPHATLMWGKSLLDESSPNFLGIYAGSASAPAVRTAILTRRGVSSPPVASPPAEPLPPPPPREQPLTQKMVWDRVCTALTPGNVVLADQGTSFYGMADHRLPQGVTFIGQPLWGSIGYTLPAALGAAVAHPDRRTVLLIGDGAAQLTVQELGTFAREGLSPVIVVVNNDGYTVERAIHGETAPYNDIVGWKWTEVPNALGVTEHLAFRVQTYGELDDALTAAARHQDRMVLVEVVLPRLEIPRLLVELVRPTSPDGSPRR
ncbi:hypothetical protein MAHJHV53_02500 [Mycobacterium avium subsp. hominissuis]